MAYKTCEHCQERNGSRSLLCSKCKKPIGLKVEPKIAKHTRSKECDVSTLKPGDLIKVSGGPIWITADGQEIKMGEEGKFRVVQVEEKVIRAIELTDRLATVIYIGPEYQSKSGTLMRPHKVTRY